MKPKTLKRYSKMVGIWSKSNISQKSWTRGCFSYASMVVGGYFWPARYLSKRYITGYCGGAFI